MSFSEEQMVDLITPVTSSSPLLDFAVSRTNVATTFAGHNSGGNMHSQEAQTSISTIISQKMDAQTQYQEQLSCSAANAMTEYLNKFHAMAVPALTMQMVKEQGVKLQLKKEKEDEEKMEQHPQSNILNIPVPLFRNTQLQNNSSLANVDQMLVPINPLDLNIHLEDEQENDSNPQSVVKVEQQMQTESPKIERKSRFRAKMGEIKISVGVDGSTYFCCAECNLGYTNKADIDRHIQAHIQERKYECKECGALLKRKEHLDQHMRGHSDERPYKCTMCDKAFKRNEHLTRHFVIHSGDKNFSCSVCHKAFSRKDHLNKHTQTHSNMRKNKMKNNTFYIEQKDSFDRSTNVSILPKQEAKYALKDGMPKQESILSQIPESVLLHNLQNHLFTKDPNILHTLSSLKEQMTREGSMLQQDDVSVDEILPENLRYIMPS